MNEDQSMPPQPLLRSELADDPEMGDLVEIFMDGLSQRVGDLEKGMHAGDAERVTQLAHQLRGSAPSYGYPTIGQAAERLELSLQNLDDCDHAIGSVRAEAEELIGLCRAAMPKAA